jgi:hypothetical protein
MVAIEAAFDTKSFPESKREDAESEKESDEKGIESFLFDFMLDGIVNILGLDDFLGEKKDSWLELSVIDLYNPLDEDERGVEPNNLVEPDFIRLDKLSLKSVIDIIVYNYRL